MQNTKFRAKRIISTNKYAHTLSFTEFMIRAAQSDWRARDCEHYAYIYIYIYKRKKKLVEKKNSEKIGNTLG